MHRQVITKNLSKPNVNIFDAIIEQIEWEHNKPCDNVQALKDRDNMRKKGDLWEAFCVDWLAATAQYDRVLTLAQFNAENPNVFKTKQDNGIDLIAITVNNKWHAVQCKYRKAAYLNWSTLSTFIALCERTKRFDKYIVMTNCKGITNKLVKSPKDKSICYKTFVNTTRDHWLTISELNTFHTLNVVDQKPVAKPNAEELRRLRLVHFENL